MRYLLLLLWCATIAQSWELSGRVLQEETLLPLRGSNVQVLDTRLGGSSDEHGYFRIEVNDRDRVQLRVTHLGWAEVQLSCERTDPDLGVIQLSRSTLDAGELTFSAELREQTARHASTKVNVLNMSAVKEHRKQDLTRVLETVPGLSIKRSDGATTNSLSIRGSSNLLGGGVGNRVLLLVDGRPALNADTGGADWSSLPMSLVERVEVVKGSGSALHGSAAMGGVIHLVSKRRFPQNQLELSLGSGLEELPSAEQRFRDTPAFERDASINWYRQGDQLGFYSSLGHRSSNGHRQNSDFDSHNFRCGWRLELPERSSRFDLGLGLQHLDRAFPHRWDSRARPLHLSHHHYEWLNDRQRKRNASLDLAWRHTGENYRLRLQGWVNALYSSSHYRDPAIRDTDSRADKYGLRLVISRHWGRSHDLSTGLDLQLDRVNGRPQEIFYGRHTANTLAAFVQDEWSLPTPALLQDVLRSPVLTSGLRVDHYTVASRDTETQWSPRLGLNLPGTGGLDNFVMRFTAGRAFRFPTIADLYLKSVPGNDYSFVANPALKAEESLSYEMGINWRPRERFQLDLARFHYDYRDMIHYRDTADVSIFEIVNLQRARIQGWEIESRLGWRQLDLILSYTQVQSRNLDTGKALPYQPEHQFFAQGTWHKGPWELGASLRRVSHTAEVRFYPTDAPKAYSLFGLSSSRQFGKTTLSLSGENLGNVAYEEMERYRLPGRVWRIQLRTRLDLGR